MPEKEKEKEKEKVKEDVSMEEKSEEKARQGSAGTGSSSSSSSANTVKTENKSTANTNAESKTENFYTTSVKKISAPIQKDYNQDLIDYEKKKQLRSNKKLFYEVHEILLIVELHLATLITFLLR